MPFCIDDEKLLEKKCVKSVNYPLLFMTVQQIWRNLFVRKLYAWRSWVYIKTHVSIKSWVHSHSHNLIKPEQIESKRFGDLF